MAPVDSSVGLKGKKQASFSNIEIEQIARSWLACSTCASGGAQQKSDVFWEKIKNHFHLSMSEFKRKYPGVAKKNVVRSLRSLGSKWTEINRDCAKFSGAMSTIIELNESGTNYEEQLEKARALYQQTHKKGQEFTFEGAWNILKDSSKWQVAARLNDKHLERAAKQKKSKTSRLDQDPVVDNDDESPPREVAMSEMVTDRPMGNKKAKDLAAIEKKTQRHKSALADSTSQIVATLNRRAQIMESRFELQLFSLTVDNLNQHATEFIKMKRDVAKLRLLRQLQDVEPLRRGIVNLPRTLIEKENIFGLDDEHLNEAEIVLGSDDEASEGFDIVGVQRDDDPEENVNVDSRR